MQLRVVNSTQPDFSFNDFLKLQSHHNSDLTFDEFNLYSGGELVFAENRPSLVVFNGYAGEQPVCTASLQAQQYPPASPLMVKNSQDFTTSTMGTVFATHFGHPADEPIFMLELGAAATEEEYRGHGFYSRLVKERLSFIAEQIMAGLTPCIADDGGELTPDSIYLALGPRGEYREDPRWQELLARLTDNGERGDFDLTRADLLRYGIDPARVGVARELSATTETVARKLGLVPLGIRIRSLGPMYYGRLVTSDE